MIAAYLPHHRSQPQITKVFPAAAVRATPTLTQGTACALSLGLKKQHWFSPDVEELRLIFLKPLRYGFYLRVDLLTPITQG